MKMINQAILVIFTIDLLVSMFHGLRASRRFRSGSRGRLRPWAEQTMKELGIELTIISSRQHAYRKKSGEKEAVIYMINEDNDANRSAFLHELGHHQDWLAGNHLPSMWNPLLLGAAYFIATMLEQTELPSTILLVAIVIQRNLPSLRRAEVRAWQKADQLAGSSEIDQAIYLQTRRDALRTYIPWWMWPCHGRSWEPQGTARAGKETTG